MQHVISRIQRLEWSLYRKRKYLKLKNSDFSIIASTCVGGIIYHDLGLPFLSPTINLTIGMNDFVKFAGDLKGYLDKDIIAYEGANECPAGMLGDIKINFVHYKTFEEGRTKWNERKKRINWERLFVIGSERGECTYETIQRFDKLPHKNKVILTHVEYPEIKSAFCIKGFEEKEELGMILNYKDQFLKRRYLDDFDYVSFINSASHEIPFP